uniref:Protein roadkill n=1 Tax=Echinostoma caproni TaxID=27848 RepID=A0A183BDR3_9TREM
LGGSYSPYHPSSFSSRCSSRGRNETSFHSLGLPAPASACSSASSSSSSARSYLQDVYQQQQRELQYHHHQQQQQQHHPHHPHQHQQAPPPSMFSHHNQKSPVHELTTRQLLSEAAATAYAHGLGLEAPFVCCSGFSRHRGSGTRPHRLVMFPVGMTIRQ